MLILGIDPGLLVSGWCVLERKRSWSVVDHGKLTTPCNVKTGPDAVDRQIDLFKAMINWRIGLLWIDACAIEYQGPRRSNPDGYLVAELAGSMREVWSHFTDTDADMVTRNQALRAVCAARQRKTERAANAALKMMGIDLPNQHERDAAIVAVACGRRSA